MFIKIYFILFWHVGRCSVFPDLNLITFDGKSVAIYKAALYVVAQLPNETVSILVQECSGPDDPVRYALHKNLFRLAPHNSSVLVLF